MDNEVLEISAHYFIEDRLNKIVEHDEEYQIVKWNEIEAHDRFKKTLTEEQNKLFNNFIVVTSETEANIERINYQQGMKDYLYHLNHCHNSKKGLPVCNPFSLCVPAFCLMYL